MDKKSLVLLLIILVIAVFIRFYKLSSNPPGAYIDEASYGYNAYSMLLTGKDEWGKSLPIFLRSFGTYPAPLYTYLLMVPIKLFGLSIFSVRLPVALQGLAIIILTYVLANFSSNNQKIKLALVSSLVIALAPWSVLYSRLAVEVNLALMLVLIGFLSSFYIIKKPRFFILTAFIFALSSHAYAAERVMSIIFLTGIAFWYRQTLWKKKLVFITGVVLFIMVILPQLLLLNTPGAVRRYSQQNFLNHDFYNQNGKYKNIFMGEQLYYVREFLAQYSAYFSPRNLFFNPDSQISRSAPDLSVFYLWMVIPFLMGIPVVYKNRRDQFLKIVIFIALFSPLPASVTKDPFYTSRVLPLFWAISIVISLGIVDIYERLNSRLIRSVLTIVILMWSCLVLYSSYFVLLPHERSAEFGYQYQQLAQILERYKDQNIVVHTNSEFPTYIMMAFYNKYDPVKMQEQTVKRIENGYYNQIDFNERYIMDNIEVTPHLWKDDIDNRILVGNPVVLSPLEVTLHKLHPLFEIKGLNNEVLLGGFRSGK